MKKQFLLSVSFLIMSMAVFGQADMVLSGVQTNTGAKTFLNGTLLMRNVGNTFSSSFTNTNTAARTYTLPNFGGNVLVSGGTNTLAGATTFTGSQVFNFQNFAANNSSISIVPTASVSAAGASAISISPNFTTSTLFANKSGSLSFGNGITFGTNNAYHAQILFQNTLNNGGFNDGTFTGYFYNPTISGSGTGTKHYAAVFGSGFVGVGTITPTSVLHVVGSPTIVDGNQAAGKVLTSDANGVGSWQAPSSAGSDITNSAELGYYGFIKGTVGGVTQVPHLAFRGDATRAITDGVTDVYLGPNNGNTASAAGGNIGIGSYNLNQINTSGGTWTGAPYYSYFRGDRNIAIGFQNGMNLTGGIKDAASTNILIGNSVLKASTQQSYNIFVGFQSAMNMSIPFSGSNGWSNVALGQYNMQNVTGGTANFNTAIGPSVLRATTSINASNTFVGSAAGLNAQIVGSSNTVVGDDGFRDVTWTTTGNSFNTGLGSAVFKNAVEGLNNSAAVGTSSMRWGGGTNNSSIGSASGWTLRGSGNTAIGLQSAHVADNSYTTSAGTPYTGSNSTFIGYRSGYKSADAAVGNVIVIGNDFQPTLQSGNVYLGSSNDLVAFAGGSEKLRISSTGVGIGTSTPGGKLHVNGSTYIGNDDGTAPYRVSIGGSAGDYGSVGFGYKYTNAGGHTFVSTDWASQLVFEAGGFNFKGSTTTGNTGGAVTFTNFMKITETGNVGIGTTLATNPNGYKLAVNGKIGAKDVQVETSSTTWPDYVFAQDYRLPSLAEVEKFIQENNHLENVPSGTEIEKNGHSLGEMDKILLKKVEELTLYVIQQQKEIEALKKKIENK
jgi:trimeric autotransporter adhesin